MVMRQGLGIKASLRELTEVFRKDIMSEGFTRRDVVVYGILVPMGLIAACVLGEFINSL